MKATCRSKARRKSSVRSLGFDHTAVGWAHIDWPALRADPVAEADRVRRIMEPLGLDVDDSFIWFHNKYLDGLQMN